MPRVLTRPRDTGVTPRLTQGDLRGEGRRKKGGPEEGATRTPRRRNKLREFGSAGGQGRPPGRKRLFAFGADCVGGFAVHRIRALEIIWKNWVRFAKILSVVA